MNNLYELVTKAQNKNKNAIMDIICKFQPLINKYARKLSYDDAKSELAVTLIQTVIFLPIKRKQYLRDDKCIVGYINKSIINKYIYLSKIRNKINQKETELNLDLCADKYYVNIDNSILIRNLLDKLPKLQKYIIIQKFFFQYSDVEIGKKLCISRQAVNRIKNRALKNMKEQINY